MAVCAKSSFPRGGRIEEETDSAQRTASCPRTRPRFGLQRSKAAAAYSPLQPGPPRTVNVLASWGKSHDDPFAPQGRACRLSSACLPKAQRGWLPRRRLAYAVVLHMPVCQWWHGEMRGAREKVASHRTGLDGVTLKIEVCLKTFLTEACSFLVFAHLVLTP